MNWHPSTCRQLQRPGAAVWRRSLAVRETRILGYRGHKLQDCLEKFQSIRRL